MRAVFGAESEDRKRCRRHPGVGQHQREQELVPCRDEDEDAGRDDSAHRERDHDAGEHADFAASVDDRRFAQLRCDLAEEAAQQPDRERQIERREDDDQHVIGVELAELGRDEIERNDDRHARHHPRHQDGQQESAPRREMRQRIGRKRRDRDDERRRADRDDDAVDEVVLKSGVGEDVAEAIERRAEDEPRRHGQRVDRVAEPGHDHPSVGKQIDQHDHDPHRGEQNAPQRLMAIHRHGLMPLRGRGLEQRPEQRAADGQHDDHEHQRDRGRAADVERVESGLEREDAHRGGNVAWAARGHQEDLVEIAHRRDGPERGCDQHVGCEERQRDVAQDLHRAGAVDLGGRDQVLVDRLQPGEQDQHEERRGLPDVSDDDRDQRQVDAEPGQPRQPERVEEIVEHAGFLLVEQLEEDTDDRRREDHRDHHQRAKQAAGEEIEIEQQREDGAEHELDRHCGERIAQRDGDRAPVFPAAQHVLIVLEAHIDPVAARDDERPCGEARMERIEERPGIDGDQRDARRQQEPEGGAWPPAR